MQQLEFIEFTSFPHGNKKSRRQRFLEEMDLIVPWDGLEKIIQPYYENRIGRKRIPLSVMLRIYFLQNWYSLSDPAMEEELGEIPTLREFANIRLNGGRIPDETSILNFRHLLEKNNLTEKMFQMVNKILEEKKILLKNGTIVDATIIDAPKSTKNQEQKRNPEMSSTNKNGNWFFGCKLHIGVDAQSGLVHSISTTTAKVHDSVECEKLLRKKDKYGYGDKAYPKKELVQRLKEKGLVFRAGIKKSKNNELTEAQKKRNKRLSQIRCKVEHTFRVIKCQFKYIKTKYRTLEKNGHQFFTLVMLANIYQVRKKLMAA